MKKLLILLFAAFLAIAPAAARKTPGDKVGASFESLKYEFGTVSSEDAPVTHEFVFTVTGDSPVAILSANANCGCTTPEYNRKPTAPGKTNAVKVSFVPKGQRGEIYKEIRVRLKNGDGKSETITLLLTGFVDPKR
ncbi:MAG: DUF1573 domain-containing protein [Muribaculaceae bacterium]|nr:DUF1573 domain-containing protein [Muribaculaceae bacterium]